MITPTVERHFAAVRITTTTSAYHLNHERLTAAIRYLDTGTYQMSAAERLESQYPGLTPREVGDYLAAAQVCIDHNIEP